MLKATLKKELQKLTKEQLIEQTLDLYDKNKLVKEFYSFYLNLKNENELEAKEKEIDSNAAVKEFLTIQIEGRKSSIINILKK